MGVLSRLTVNLGMNSAELRTEIDKADKKTKKFKKSAKDLTKQNNVLVGSFRSAAQGVAAIDGPLGGVSGRLSAVSSLANNAHLGIAALGVGLAGTAAAVYKSVQALSDLETRLLTTEALVKATGSAAGLTSQELDKQARTLALNTLASTQDIREAQNVLQTFLTIQEDRFTKAIELSQDLATVMKTSAKSAALQLGKALEDPANGLTALKKAGVSFSVTEKENIRLMMESGQIAEAQTAILKKLETQVGGTGAAAAGGTAGSVDTLGQKWEELLEGFAKTTQANSTVKSFLDTISGGIDSLTKKINPSDEQRLTVLTDERLRLQQKIDALEGKRDNRSKNLLNRLKSQSAELRDQISVIQERELAELEARKAADESAKQVLENTRKEQADARLKKEQEVSAKSLAALQFELAGKQDRLTIAHEKRLADIKALNLSEQEVERQGFASIEALKTELSTQSENRLREGIARKEQLERDRVNRSIAFALTDEERERQAFANKKVILENARLDGNISDARHKELVEREAERHQKRLNEIEEEGLSEREKFSRLSVGEKTEHMLGMASKAFSGAASHSKKMFKLTKKLGIAEATANMFSGAERTWSTYPYPYNIPMTALHVAGSLTRIAKLKKTSFSSASTGGASGGGGGSVSTPTIRTPSVLDSGYSNVSNIDQSSKRPLTINFYGDVVGDSADFILEKMAEKVNDLDYVLFDSTSRTVTDIQEAS